MRLAWALVVTVTWAPAFNGLPAPADTTSTGLAGDEWDGVRAAVDACMPADFEFALQ